MPKTHNTIRPTNQTISLTNLPNPPSPVSHNVWYFLGNFFWFLAPKFENPGNKISSVRKPSWWMRCQPICFGSIYKQAVATVRMRQPLCLNPCLIFRMMCMIILMQKRIFSYRHWLRVFCKQFYGFMRVLAPARKVLSLQPEYGNMVLPRIIWLVWDSVPDPKLTDPVGLSIFCLEMTKVFIKGGKCAE